MKIDFINGKILTWPLNSSMREAFTLGSRCEGIYKINGKPNHALVHDIDLKYELWHKIFSHLHYKVLPNVRKMVSAILKIRMDHEGVCPGCASRKHIKGPFPQEKQKLVRYFSSYILIYVDLCLLLLLAATCIS